MLGGHSNYYDIEGGSQMQQCNERQSLHKGWMVVSHDQRTLMQETALHVQFQTKK